MTEKILPGQLRPRRSWRGVLGIVTFGGEIDNSVSSISQKMQLLGEEAAQQIEQQIIDIRKQLTDLFSDVLKAGEAVGQMSEMVRKGEESQKSLNTFLEETRSRLEVY